MLIGGKINFYWMTEEQLKKLLKLKEKSLFKTWLPQLKRPMKKIKIEKGTWTKTFDSSTWDQNAKESLLVTVHPLAIYEFMLLFSDFPQMPGPHKNITKALSLLLQLKKGLSNCSDELPIKLSTFRDIYQKFWVKGSTKISDWCDNWMKRFSNVEVRNLYSKIYFPDEFQHVTIFMDGKDFEVILEQLSNEETKNKSGRSSLISRKLSWRKGGKFVIVMDSRGFSLKISRMVGCNEEKVSAIYVFDFWYLVDIHFYCF